MTEHRLIGDTLVGDDRGIEARCICGWKSGPRFTSMVASALFQDHQETPEAPEPPPMLELPTPAKVKRFCSYCGTPESDCQMVYAGATGLMCRACLAIDENVEDYATRHLAFLDARENELYEVARKVTHDMGLPWTDPRTRRTYPAPKKENTE